jgi:cellulase/cellobiase CelA1
VAGEPRAPEAGAWFDHQIKMLVANSRTVFPQSIWANAAVCAVTPAPVPQPTPAPQPTPQPTPVPQPTPSQYWRCQQCVLIQ